MAPISTKELWSKAGEMMGKQSPPEASGEPHPADDTYTVPFSSVKLPSRGLVYPMDSALYRCESVDIKSVTAKEEDILASATLIKKGIVLTSLMQACITNRMINPDQMLVGDRNAVLVSIRISAYGPKYACSVVCPECGEKDNDHAFDISKLSLKQLEVEPLGGPGTNVFGFKLPISGREVTFKLMGAGEVAQLDKDMEAVSKKGQDRSITMRLMTQLLSIQGVEQKDMHKAIASMQARDARALRAYMDDIAPGVDMEQDFECQSCGEITTVDIPIGVGFFWPTGV